MRPDGTGLRIAALGNCQVLGLGDALRAFLPRAEVEVFRLTTLGTEEETAARSAEIAARLRGFTHVFAHPMEGARFGPLAADRIAAREPRVAFVPIIVFTGFHPDCVYLRAGGRKLIGPMGEYHSAIIAGAFALGLSEAETARLFNKLVMRRLNHMGAFPAARAQLVEHFAALGHDVLPRLDTWSQGGAFMHSINHPRILAIADVCRMVLAQAGLGEHPLEAAEGVRDVLAQPPLWPVYPPVAESLGVPGSYDFHGFPRGTDLPQPMTLESFIGASFATYAKEPAALEEAVAGDRRMARVRETLRKLPEHVR
jgi:hypothetical protein